jgi:MFS family permease
MTLNPIIAPLSREVGLAEWQIGATISAAAITLVATSQIWGRRSQSWGRKPVLVAAFALATATMTLFGLVACLLRVGGVGAVIGFILLAPDLGAVPLFVAILLVGLGLGTAMPGYTAGPTLLVDRDEQGGLAGLTGATTGLTFVVAPTAGTALYGLWTTLPVIVGAVIMGGITVFVLVHPRFRAPGADVG